MRVAFLNNCSLVLSLAWRLIFCFREFVNSIDSMIGSRGRFSGVVVPMAAMAAVASLLSTIVYTRDYQSAVAGMLYVFGSFLLIYILMMLLLNFISRSDFFTDNPSLFCERAKTFVASMLFVHFDVRVVLAFFPSFSVARLFEFFVIYLSWTMTRWYMPVPRNRNAFGIGTGVIVLILVKSMPLVVRLCFPAMPI